MGAAQSRLLISGACIPTRRGPPLNNQLLAVKTGDEVELRVRAGPMAPSVGVRWSTLATVKWSKVVLSLWAG